MTRPKHIREPSSLKVSRLSQNSILDRSFVPGSYARATAIAVALAFLVPGCEMDQASTALRVVHVCGESGFRAGTPVDSRRIISTIAFPEEDSGIVGDGFPLYRLPTKGRLRIDLPNPSTKSILMAYAGVGTFQANAICGNAKIRPGTRVWLGGYSADSCEKSATEFLISRPTIVSAVVIQRPDVAPFRNYESYIWISAPSGDYRAFVGGPVAIDRAGKPGGICGVIAIQFQGNQKVHSGHATIGVQPIQELLDSIIE